MFGNLSKTLIKAPHYFNNNVETEPTQYSKLSRGNLLDTYSNLRKFKTRNDTSRYFKEKDFIKRNLRLDLNYNNNFRKEITPLVRTKHCISFEEFIFGNSNNNSKVITKESFLKTNRTNITNKMKTTNKSNIAKSFDSKKNPFSVKENKFKDFLEKKLIKKNKIDEFNLQVKSNIDNLIRKINDNSLNFNKIGNYFDKNGKNRIENLKEYINRNTVVEAPVKLKFPEIKIKSNDTLYMEAMDQKIKSLSMIKPKIKEQLKSKNRVFVSEKDYYRYNNSYAMYKKNPFYETVKYIEENKKKE